MVEVRPIFAVTIIILLLIAPTFLSKQARADAEVAQVPGVGQFLTVGPENGNIYASGPHGLGIVAISSSSNEVIANIQSAASPSGAAFDPQNGYVYVPNQNNNTILVIAASTNTVVTTINIGGLPYAPLFNPSNGDVYVSYQNSTGGLSISVISGKTNTVIASIADGGSTGEAAVDSATGNIYAPCGLAPSTTYDYICVVSGSSNTILTTIPISGIGVLANSMVLYDPSNGNIYVAAQQFYQQTGNVSVISTATNSIITTISVGNLDFPDDTYPMLFDPANGEIYVSNYASSTISVISGSTNSLISTINPYPSCGCASSPYGGIFDSNNSHIYVPNNDGFVSVISGENNSVLENVQINSGGYGYSGIFNPVNGDIYISSNGIAFVISEATTTHMSCSPLGGIDVGTMVTCSAYVTIASTNVTPAFPETGTGTITWSSSAIGSFNSTSCALGSLSHACSVTYIPTKANQTVVITAEFNGDELDWPSSGGSSSFFVKAQSSTSVRCSPASLEVSSSVSCVVSVNGYEPTGTVELGSNASGASSSSSCSLNSGVCSANYTLNTAGEVNISAFYGGDFRNTGSSGSFVVDVAPLSATSVTNTAVSSSQRVDTSSGSQSVTSVSSSTSSQSNQSTTSTVSAPDYDLYAGAVVVTVVAISVVVPFSRGGIL